MMFMLLTSPWGDGRLNYRLSLRVVPQELCRRQRHEEQDSPSEAMTPTSHFCPGANKCTDYKIQSNFDLTVS